MTTESSELEVYVTREGIAWVHDPARRGSFASIVLRHAGLDRDALSAAVARVGEPKLSRLAGATLPHGSISPDALRDAVGEHNATLLAPLLGERDAHSVRVHGTLATGQVFAFPVAELREVARQLARRGALFQSNAFATPRAEVPAHAATPRTRKVNPTGDMLAAPVARLPVQRVGPAAIQEGLRCLQAADGFCGAAIARLDNGVVLGSIEGAKAVPLVDAIESAGESLRITQAYTERQPLPDRVEEIVFSTREHHYLARRVGSREALFVLLVVARDASPLGMASHALRQAESALVI